MRCLSTTALFIGGSHLCSARTSTRCAADRYDHAHYAACCYEFAASKRQPVFVIASIPGRAGGGYCPGIDYDSEHYLAAALPARGAAICQPSLAYDLIRYPSTLQRGYGNDFPGALGGRNHYRRLDHTGSRWNRNTLQVVKGDDGALACSLTYGNCEKAPCKRYTPGVFSAQPPRTCLHSYHRRHRLYLVGRVAPPTMGYYSAGDHGTYRHADFDCHDQ